MSFIQPPVAVAGNTGEIAALNETYSDLGILYVGNLSVASMVSALTGNRYVINYWPQGQFQAWWGGTWYDAHHSTVAADLAIIAGLGFNVARVTLEASAYNATDGAGAFNFSSPLTTQLARLTDLCARAKTAGTKLQLCLFDLWGNYGQIAGSKTWMAAVIGAIDPTVVAVIEIQNELNFTSSTTYSGGFDAGWTGSQSGVTVGSATTVWAQTMIPYVRGLANAYGIPVVASTTDSTGATLVQLPAAVAALTGPALPSWHEWHIYPAAAGDFFPLVAAAKAVCTTAALVIGETGFPATAGGSLSQAQAYQQQADFFQNARWACEKLGLRPPAPWGLYNMNSQNWGLYDGSGTAQAAAKLYQTYPASVPVPIFNIRSGFTTTVADANSQAVPISWALYHGNTGNQTITCATTGGVCTLTVGTNSNSDNVPGLTSAPIEMPIYPGQTYTLSATLSGTITQAGLVVNWWDKTGTYISNAGSYASITGTPTMFSTTVTAPTNTVYATLSIDTGYTAGTLAVSSPSFMAVG